MIVVSWSASAASPNALPESARYWPQWRGPLQTGVAPQGDPPTEWSETKNVKWKIKIPGEGSATPVIWEDKIFVLTAIPTGKKKEPKAADAREQSPRVAGAPQIAFGQVQTPQNSGAGADQPRQQRGGPGGQGRGRGGSDGPPPTEIHQWTALCVDRNTGKILWQKIAREEVPHEGHQSTGSFAPSSPATDGKHLFAYFGSRGLYCYDLQGNLKWQKDFGRMRTKNSFGEGSSPALSGNTIVINWDHEGDDFIVALDKETGKELWRQPREEETSWTTPLIVEHAGKPQVVVSATSKIRSYDLASGKLLWECAGLGANAIPTPVAGQGMVYAMTGYTRPALLAIQLGRTGDLTGTDAIAWSLNRSTPYVSSPVLYGDLLYFFSNRNAVLSCFDAKSGRAHYQEKRLEALTGAYASPVGAAGKVYLVGQNGVTLVIKNADQFEVLATNKLDDGIDASPAIVGKELFLRGRQNLYCIAE